MVKVRVRFGFMAGFVVRVRAREGLGLVLWLNSVVAPADCAR